MLTTIFGTAVTRAMQAVALGCCLLHSFLWFVTHRHVRGRRLALPLFYTVKTCMALVTAVPTIVVSIQPLPLCWRTVKG